MRVVHVLFLADVSASRELGPALWAALLEVEQFFNKGSRHLEVERFYMSPHAPTSNLLAGAWRGVGRLLGGRGGSADILDLIRARHLSDSRVESSEIAGRYSRTVDQEKLIRAIREQLEPSFREAPLMVITDQEIVPPPEWRYIIWDGIGEDSVVSIAPTDPHYWRQRDPLRVARIKHRVRTASLSVTGETLGLTRCDNPFCVMYADVESVGALDFMTQLCPEHDGFEELTGQGYAPVEATPQSVQTVTDNPEPDLSY